MLRILGDFERPLAGLGGMYGTSEGCTGGEVVPPGARVGRDGMGGGGPRLSSSIELLDEAIAE